MSSIKSTVPLNLSQVSIKEGGVGFCGQNASCPFESLRTFDVDVLMVLLQRLSMFLVPFSLFIMCGHQRYISDN